jgi:hypothetical protein
VIQAECEIGKPFARRAGHVTETYIGHSTGI